MNHSKSIYEKIKLYQINLLRNKKISLQKNKNKISNNLLNKNIKKKQSKIAIFFKFLFGFIGSFFEYLVLKSNQKNFAKNSNKNNLNGKVLEFNKNEFTKKEKETNIEKNIQQINKTIVKKEVSVEKNIQQNNKNDIKEDVITNLDINEKIVKTKKKNNAEIIKRNDFINEEKKQIVLIEEKIIYSNTENELYEASKELLNIKKNLIEKKENNINSQKKIDNGNTSFNNTDNVNNQKDSNDSKKINNEQEIIKNASNDFSEDVNKEKNSILENNVQIDNLIKRCDEDIELISERKVYLNLEEKFEQQINDKSTNVKINKKDLKKIKESVLNIVASQKVNLENLNNLMNEPYDDKMFILKLKNFLKSTTKLAFSIVPFFAFPNKVFGLATSALFFNRSIKGYRIKPNRADINNSINSMINNNEICLKIGINNCYDSLNEIENIEYYLNGMPYETKDSVEYRKYLISVESTKKLIQKQIELMKNLSKKYDDIKVKVKKREN